MTELKIIDSSCWIEYFKGTDYGKLVKEYCDNPNLIILPTIIIYEVYKFFKQKCNDIELNQIIEYLNNCNSTNINKQISIYAADLSIKYKLPMADSYIYATSLVYQASLVTFDSHFKELPFVEYYSKS